MHGGGADRMTKYVVLVKKQAGFFEEFAVEEAGNAEQAARTAYMKNTPDSQVVAIVAVPERSWKPTPVRTETVSRVVLGEAPDPPEAA
jgi:hypothetical protein